MDKNTELMKLIEEKERDIPMSADTEAEEDALYAIRGARAGAPLEEQQIDHALGYLRNL